jgi:hypothetical protein
MISKISVVLVVLGLALVGCDKGPSAAEGEAHAANKAEHNAGHECEGHGEDKASEGAHECGGAEGMHHAKDPNARKKAPTQTAEGKVYGEGVGDGETTEVGAILANPEKFENKEVRVEGMITDVCPKRGCWFEMAGKKPGEKLRFKVQDGVMVFPMDAKGKKAVAQGTVKVRRLTLEETKEYMEYQAKEYGKEYDPSKVTEPTMIVRIDGKGAVVRN